jgi:hypothetical protein
MTNDVIFSRKMNNEPLTRAEVIERAPAAMQFLKGSERGKHYAHINTSEAIDILADYGFNVTQAAQVKARTRSANVYAQHMLALSNPDYTSSEGTPQVVLFNSGNGKSALRMFAGFYRFICSNSLVAGSGFEVKASHSKATANTFEDMIKQTAETFPAMLEQVERMKEIQVDTQAEQRLARQAVDLRWDRLSNKHFTEEGFLPGIYSTGTTAASLIQVRRSGDMGQNLWTTYNKIQEGLIRGGSDIFSITKRNPSGVNRKARPLNGVKASLEVNRKLWDLVNNQAEVMA